MIFSYDDLNSALRTLGYYYNKILLVDFVNDKYRIIKINDKEYNTLKNLNIPNFYDWINGFKTSRYSMNLNYNFDPNMLAELKQPLVLNYKKLINNQFKDVTMELIPAGQGMAYVMIKDYLADVPKPCSREDCENCSEQC